MFRKKINMLSILAIWPLLAMLTMPAGAVECQWEESPTAMGTTYYGLVPSASYAYFLVNDDAQNASLTGDGNLLYIDQQTADDSGVVSFAYAANGNTVGKTALRGENSRNARELTWGLEPDGTMTVFGTALVQRDAKGLMPWDDIKNQIKAVCLDASVEAIGANAFADCSELISIEFLGDAPDFDRNCFAGVTCNVFYPKDNNTWTEARRQDYGGNIQWLPGPVFTPVETITLNEVSIELDALETFQLIASVLPVDAQYPEIIWTSSNESVAKVDEAGMVQAVAKGTADITAASSDGSEISAVCAVTVKNTVYTEAEIPDLESSHPYDNDSSDIWIFVSDGTKKLNVTFDSRTELADQTDYLVISDREGNEIGRYTGTELADQTVTVPGDTIRIQLLTDEAGTAWGFKVTDIQITGSGHIHQYQAEIIPATCLERGYTVFTCQCGDSYTGDYVDAKGHHYGKWKTVSPFTCTEDGEERKDCQNCDHYETRTVAARHVPEDLPAVAPTCTQSGLTEGSVCTVCEEVLQEQQKVAATGHTEATIDPVDAGCETVGTEGGSYCTVCNATLTKAVKLPALGHSWNDGMVALQPTEHMNGIKTYTCTRCGREKDEHLPALAHVHQYSEQEVLPTCTQQGYTVYSCSCGASYLDCFTAPVGHTGTAAAAVPPSCTQAGFTEGIYCDNCGQTIGREELPALGHDWDEGEQIQSPTENTPGTVLHSCSRCTETREETVPVLGHAHSYAETVVPASCTASGYAVYTCECGDSYETMLSVALGHTEVIDSGTEAGCTEPGFTDGSHCSVCGAVIVEQSILPAKGHNWDQGTTMAEPTQKTDGLIVYTCGSCGETKESRLAALEHVHTYEESIITSNCADQGYTHFVCQCGDQYKDYFTDTLDDHMEVVAKAVEATCTTDGLTAGKYCSVCGEVILEQEVVPAKHKTENGVCTVCGVYGTCGENLNWSFDGDSGILTIFGTGEMDNFYDGVQPWEKLNKGIRSVAVKEGVTGIGAQAFLECEAMTTLCLPATLATICEDSLPVIGSMEAIIVADKNTEYDTEAGILYTEGQHALMKYPAKKAAVSCTVPDTVTVIAYNAFVGCSNLNELTFTGSAPGIDNTAFAGTTLTAYYPSGNETWTEDVMQDYGGTITWVAYEPEPEIEKFDLTGITATFGDSLALNFVINTAKLEGEGHYAMVTKEYADGTSVQVRINQGDWPVYSGNLRYFSFDGVAAKEMMDTITAVVYNSKGQAVTNTYVTSLQDYCIRAWNKEAEKASPDTDKLTLYIDMLNYGAAAQTKFGYDTGNLANASLTEVQQSYATTDSAVTEDNVFVKGNGCAGITLTLVSQIELNFVFQNATIDQTAYAIATFTDHYGHDKEVRIEEFGVYNSSLKYVAVTGMSAADCSKPVTLKLYDSDGNVLSTCVESVTSMCTRATSSNALYWACLKYCQAAYKYFH